MTRLRAAPPTSPAYERFISITPPAGATEFPLETIIVKKTDADGKLFAQVKRGGGYNLAGAKNWEWFEIAENSAEAISIAWHGTAPIAGDDYGAGPTTSCNSCHMNGAANDYVIAPGLTLSGFAASSPDAGSDAAIETDAAARE
jgi:hypothetical protein